MFARKSNYFIVFVALPIIVLSLLLLFVANNQIKNNSDQKANIVEIVAVVSPSPVVEKKKDVVDVLLAGDVMLGRTVMTKARELNDPAYPFNNVKGELLKADIVFVNLENPIVEDCPIHEDGYKFCSTPDMVEGLVGSGVDVVTVANNHSNNYGQEGLTSTQKILSDNSILVTGIGGLVVKEVEDTTFGFLGFDLLTNVLKQEDLELIKESSEKVDVLVVGIHWGAEYTDAPFQKQRVWAGLIVDAGADVIVGHHPHWVQEIEYINDVPVYYSLGNFVFDQMWSEETKKGLVVKLSFEDGEIVGEEMMPTYMSFHAQPDFVE